MKNASKTSVCLKPPILAAVFLTASLLLAGCGGGSSSGGSIPGSTASSPVTPPVVTPPVVTPPVVTPPVVTPPVVAPPPSVSMTLSATQGGTFQGPGVYLVVSTGSLAQDTVITETPVVRTALPTPPAGQVLISCYDGTGGAFGVGDFAPSLGPVGTTLSSPASLLIYTDASLPANVPLSSLALYRVVNGAYQLVPGSTAYTFRNGAPAIGVTVSLTSFGTYAILGTVSP